MSSICLCVNSFSAESPVNLYTVLMSFCLLPPTSQYCYLQTHYDQICFYSSNFDSLLISEGCRFSFLFKVSPFICILTLFLHLLWDLIPSLPSPSCTFNLSRSTNFLSLLIWSSISTYPFQQLSILFPFLFCLLCYICLHHFTETASIKVACLSVKSRGISFISHLYSSHCIPWYLSAFLPQSFSKDLSSAHSVIIHFLYGFAFSTNLLIFSFYPNSFRFFPQASHSRISGYSDMNLLYLNF